LTRRRGPGARDPTTRSQLIDAAEALMLDEGYAAVTSRRVGQKAGLTPQLVHYYFRSMDDLYLEVFRRRADEGLARLAEALASRPSLVELWNLRATPPGSTFILEFASLANHRKAIRAEVARYAERYREMQIEAVTHALTDAGISTDDVSPEAVVLAISGLSQIMAADTSLGIKTGHDETVAFVERLLGGLDRSPG
jgi:AcrR family transcriptional regulator